MKIHTQVWNYIPRYEASLPGMNLHSEVWNFMLRYDTSCPGMKLHTQSWAWILSYKTSCPGMNLQTKVWNFVHRYETTSSGLKLRTHERNYIPRNETTYPGTKLRAQMRTYIFTQVRSFMPRHETSYLGLKFFTHSNKCELASLFRCSSGSARTRGWRRARAFRPCTWRHSPDSRTSWWPFWRNLNLGRKVFVHFFKSSIHTYLEPVLRQLLNLHTTTSTV
jgi:hypothetical protein